MVIMALLLALVMTIWVGYMIVKKYKPQPVLFFGGMVLMAGAVMLGVGTILPAKEATGFGPFDMFEFIRKTLSSRAAGLGLSIMAVGGFARYMEHIGASRVLVKIAIKPLGVLKAP